MAGVGDEPPHPLLVALTGVERLVDVVEQRVQGVADAPDLGARVGLGARGTRSVIVTSP